MIVTFTTTAFLQYEDISDCILRKFGQKSRERFTLKVDEKVAQLLQFPESCPKLEGYPSVYKAVLTKQTTLFYNIDYKSQEISIVSVFDTRQDPEKAIKK